MRSVLSPSSFRNASLGLGFGLVALLLASCGSARSSTVTPESAPSATSAEVTIQVQEIRRYDSGVEMRLSIANHSANAIRFPRMQTTFTSLQIIGSEAHIYASRIEQTRVPFGVPYTVGSGSENILTVQFNRRGLDASKPLTLQVQAQQAGSWVSWTLPIPPVGG